MSGFTKPREVSKVLALQCISAEIALLRLQSEIIVALFLFASRSFLANNLHFKVKVIDKANEINIKIHKNETMYHFKIDGTLFYEILTGVYTNMYIYM